MPTQAMYLLAREKVWRDAFIRVQDGNRGDEKQVARSAGERLVGCGALCDGGRVAQRGTVLRGLIDEVRRRTPVPL